VDMFWQYVLYVAFVSLGALGCAYLAVWSWRQRSTRGAGGLAFLLLTVTVWCALVAVAPE